MAWKYFIKYQHNYIQSYRFGKNQQRNKRCNTKSKFVCSWFLKLWDICWQKWKRKNQCSIINKFMYENCATKVQHQKTKNRTVILIFPKYCTYLFICGDIHSKVLWNGAKCTDDRLVPWNELWFKNLCPVQQNNECVMCSCILWCKNVMHLKK